MAMKALAGIESLRKKKRVDPPQPKVEMPYTEIDEEEPAPVVVRVPRTTTSAIQKTVDKMSDGSALIDNDNLGESIEIQARRADVMAWMLNGHTYQGELLTEKQLSDKLGVASGTVARDIDEIKQKMAKFYTEDDDTKEIAALAHMLMEMKFQDRGRALNLYNDILKDMKAADEHAAKREAKNQFSKLDGFGRIAGKDRAAMYSAALAAIDLSNRTTNGMESLLKITGGAQKLQLIIKAKNLNVTNNKIGLDSVSVQTMIEKLMGAVLPSNRAQNPQLKLPPMLDLTLDDENILSIGEEAHSRKGKSEESQ